MDAPHTQRWQDVGVGAAIMLAAFAAYGPVWTFQFLIIDDHLYVADAPMVVRGLTREGVVWAMFNTDAYNWHPLTWLSHMLDVSLFGLEAGMHHLTNLVIHAINGVLLYALLRVLIARDPHHPVVCGGASSHVRLAAAMAGLLLAIHPAHVESVAWIAERKDVLSLAMALLALLAYVGYARRPAWHRYLLVALLHLLALMAKPMMVTLPCVMLLLDYWPIRRRPPAAPSTAERPGHDAITRADAVGTTMPAASAVSPSFALWLVIEKVPLFAFSGLAALLTVLAQDRAINEGVPLGARLGNATVSYARYLGMFAWPVDLSPFYQHPGDWPISIVAGSGALIAGCTILAFLGRRSRPYVLVGWLWFLGTLVPVIGLVQVGGQALACRYTYLPFCGLYLVVSAFAHRRMPSVAHGRSSWPRHVVVAVFLAVCLSLAVATRKLASHWRDSVALFSYAVELEPNHRMFNNLGVALAEAGDRTGAIGAWRRSVELWPNERAYINLGLAHWDMGHPDEGLRLLMRAAACAPTSTPARLEVAKALGRLGRHREALAYSEMAVNLRPDLAAPRFEHAQILARNGRYEDSIRQFTMGLTIEPDNATAHFNLAGSLTLAGRIPDAIDHYQRAIELRPDFPRARQRLEAIRSAQQLGESQLGGSQLGEP